MAASLLFAELLASGSLATVFLFLVLYGLGADIPDPNQYNAQIQLVLAVPTLAFVYAFGIIADSAADRFASLFNHHWRQTFGLKKGHSMICLVLQGKSHLFFEKFMEYIRIRMRLARSLYFHGLLICPAGVWVVLMRYPSLRFKYIAAWILFWSIICVLAFKTYRKLDETWYRNLAIAWGDWPLPRD